MIIIILFLMTCTVFDYAQEKMIFSSRLGGNLAKFSLFKSTARILNTKHNSSFIPVIHGFRTLSIFWIIYGHSFTARLFTPFVNSVDKYKVSLILNNNCFIKIIFKK